MNRRRFLIAASAAPILPFTDGQTIVNGDHEHMMTDILVPSARAMSGSVEPAAAYARAVLAEALVRGAPLPGAGAADRWGRATGPVAFLIAGRVTTLQEILLAEGAARVAPQSNDFQFIDRCFAAERIARAAGLGLWADKAYRIRDAARAERSEGFQIYAGAISSASDRRSRVFFNFGDDYQTDFTASVASSAFRRWKRPVDLSSLAGTAAEIRGHVDWINGPSIDLMHELQIRFYPATP